MYLRETKRRNRDGSTVSYLQLAHSERHPVTGVPSAKVIHNFGRAEAVDRDALARLVASISRFLDPEQAMAAAHTGEIEVLDSRRFGGAWLLDRLWERLGVGAALHRVAAGRRIDGGVAERVLFALVAQRALAPGSKLAATRWVAERVAIADCPGFSDDSAYAAMDFLLDALGEIAARIFDSVAHLLNLDVDIVFVDSTSTYWEVDGADELADLQPDPQPDDGVGKAVEGGQRRFGKSKDHREDLPQVVIAMAVTRDGIPVRCWTFPGSESDQRIIRTVKDDLGAWQLRAQVGRHRVGEETAQAMPARGLLVHERFGAEVVLRRSPFDGVGGQGEWRAAETDQGDAPLELAAQETNRLEHVAERLGLEQPQARDVGGRPDRVGNPRSLALDEVEVEPHRREREEQVREENRRVEVDDVERLRVTITASSGCRHSSGGMLPGARGIGEGRGRPDA